MEDERQLDLSTPRGRVLWVLAHIYAGNQRRMARHVDISPAAVSRLVRGEQRAGPNLLKAVASNGRISKEWLETGLGEPLAASAPKALAGRGMLPMTDAILPGAPADHPLALSGEHYPVAGFHSRPTRYWLKVTEQIPEKARLVGRLEPEDLVLMEADPRGWRDDPRVLVGKLCGVRRVRGGSPVYIFAAITASSGTGELTYDAFGQKEDIQYKRVRPPRVRPVDTGTPSEASVKAAAAPGSSPANEASRAETPEPKATEETSEPKATEETPEPKATEETLEPKATEETPKPKASEATTGDERKTLNIEDVVALPILLVRRKLDVA